MSKKPCSISFKPSGQDKPCTTVINSDLKVKKNIIADCDLDVKKCLNVKNIVYDTETIDETGQTVSGEKSISWINTNGTGVLEDGVKDGLYKKVIKIIDSEEIIVAGGGTSSWYQEAGLTDNNAYSINNNFGESVAISSDGKKTIVGVPEKGDNKGAGGNGKVYIYGFDGSNWVQQAGLTASDGAPRDNFGLSVSMNSDGTKVIIGAYGHDVSSPNSGKAYIFGFDGSNWIQEAGLTADNNSGSWRFGWSVSMNNAGDKAIIGSPKFDPSGKAYIFGLSGGNWTQEAGLTASDNTGDDNFGRSVAMNADGTKVIIGAHKYDSSSGKAYIFGLSGGSWVEQAGLTASDGATDEE